MQPPATGQAAAASARFPPFGAETYALWGWSSSTATCMLQAKAHTGVALRCSQGGKADVTMKTVLVVEHDDGVRSMLVSALETEGYHTLQAWHPVALDAALAQQPALILLDVRMQALASAAVSQQVRANHQTAAIPIVAMTFAPEDAHGTGILADAWLNKPFGLADLYRIVAHLTARADN